jgi:hypothetical protein
MDRNHPFVRVLLGCLFHVTSIDAYINIRKNGFIRPNIGHFPSSHPHSDGSCVRRIGGISLFDFSIPEDKIFFMDSYLPWENVVVSHRPITVVLKIKKACISDDVLSWKQIQDKAGDPPCMLIPYVESCSLKPISVGMVEGYVLVRQDDPENFVFGDDLAILDETIACIRRIQTGFTRDLTRFIGALLENSTK